MIFVIFCYVWGVLDYRVAKEIDLGGVLLGLSDQCVEKCASVLPLFLADLELDMTQDYLGFGIVFAELEIHFTGLVGVLSLLEITPVKI